jgi:predicted transcriptional regulator
MKKILILTIMIIGFSQYCPADTIEVGKKLPMWQSLLKGNDTSLLNECKNKVLIIHYIDPRHRDENVPASTAVQNAVIDGRLSPKYFRAIAIVDCNVSWYPDALIKKYAIDADKKMSKLNSILLFDNNGILNKKYGGKRPDTGDVTAVVLADRQGICRAIYNNKMTKEQIVELVNMAVKLQHGPALPTAKKEEESNQGQNKTADPKETTKKDAKILPDKIKVGMKLPVWKSLLENNDTSLVDACKGKALIINYIDPRDKGQNLAATKAFNKAIIDGRLSTKKFQAIGIVDCEESWAPDFLIKKFANKANKKMPKLNSLMLFDYNGILNEKYGSVHNANDVTAVILVDKQGICKAAYSGKMTKEQIEDLVNMAVKLQNEPDNQKAEK